MVHPDIPHGITPPGIRIGIAGWSIRREHVDRFDLEGSHLQRYARRFNAVEINSCFYRPHRRTTYERWAGSVPEDFRFAVKLPKAITHEARLVDAIPALDTFLMEVSGLGSRLGPILVQLPPSFAFDFAVIDRFLTELRARFGGEVVIEPRHETWFNSAADDLLIAHSVARVAADPPRGSLSDVPGGYQGIVYYRLHGSPRIYYSAYDASYLDQIAIALRDQTDRGIPTWCIFDNTALGAATTDALTVQDRLASEIRR